LFGGNANGERGEEREKENEGETNHAEEKEEPKENNKPFFLFLSWNHGEKRERRGKRRVVSS
jgi:hypothetical protein